MKYSFLNFKRIKHSFLFLLLIFISLFFVSGQLYSQFNTSNVFENESFLSQKMGDIDKALKNIAKSDKRISNKNIKNVRNGVLPKKIKVPIIYYDFRGDKKNPDFMPWTKRYSDGKIASIDRANRKIKIKHGKKVKEYTYKPDLKVLDSNGQINNNINEISLPKTSVEFLVEKKNRNEIILIAKKGNRKPKKSAVPGASYGMVQDHLSDDRKPILKELVNKNAFLDLWFRPSGIKGTDTRFVYDIHDNKWKWEGLKEYKPGSSLKNHYIGKNWKAKDDMANIVIYDEMEFKLKKTAPGEEEKGVYIFDSDDIYKKDYYLPLAGMGFHANKPKEHNFHFSIEMHAKFLFTGEGTFKIRGDDDLWVFIDGRLMIDMGGTHSALEYEIDVSKMEGLEIGKTYAFDLFFVERGEIKSSLRIESTLRMVSPEPLLIGLNVVEENFIPVIDKVNINIQDNEKQEHQQWKLIIKDKNGKLVRQFNNQGQIPGNLIWDGKDMNGKFVSGTNEYIFKAEGIDQTGLEWDSNHDTIVSTDEVKKGAKIEIHDIYFEPWSAKLKDIPENTEMLKRIVNLMSINKNMKVLIKGHTASFSGNINLIKLSRDRAMSVKEAMVKMGINPERFEVKGMGDIEPLDNNATESGKRRNRRVTFEIIDN